MAMITFGWVKKRNHQMEVHIPYFSSISSTNKQKITHIENRCFDHNLIIGVQVFRSLKHICDRISVHNASHGRRSIQQRIYQTLQ